MVAIENVIEIQTHVDFVLGCRFVRLDARRGANTFAIVARG
jgi:hypothetical protein